ncbi:protein jim lovell isoform X2 [Aethina tumida]|uniref:protein jim lovell isoform X2 n=1 Tax=Aethina tumida TaxID=116153 RepID=UPI002148F833|nr:protein jim lovell isoform X2 [Aethina tumida]
MEQKINLRGDHYNLKWNSFTQNLIQVLQAKQSSAALTDVTLYCEGHFIKAHKIVLAASSVIFEEMFKYHEEKNPCVILNGVNIRDLQYIIEFMYNGQTNVYDGDLQGVLNLGETLQIKGLSSVKVKDVANATNSIGGTVNTTVNNNSNNVNLLSQPAKLFVPILNLCAQPQKVKKEEQETTDKLPKNNSNENIPPKKRKLASEISESKENVEKPTDLTMDKSVKTENNSTENPSPISRPKSPHECDHPYFVHDGGSLKKLKKTPSQVIKIEKLAGTSTKNTYKIDIPEKVPRPPNAFMIFANEWRRKLAIENPNDSNKIISIKLGNMWKNFSPEEKQVYYAQAKKADEVHKIKYPNPKEARIRKAAANLGKGVSTDKAMELVNMVVKESAKTDNFIENFVEIEVQDEDSFENADVTEEPAEIPEVQEIQDD